jgi:hypothetical protein
MSNAIGHHVWLRCNDWEAAEALEAVLDEVLHLLTGRRDVTLRVSKESGVDASSLWRAQWE